MSFPSASVLPCAVLDIVGTGGDGIGSVNISTGATVIAAAAGARVAKHGNRSVSSLCGSADVVEVCGGCCTLSCCMHAVVHGGCLRAYVCGIRFLQPIATVGCDESPCHWQASTAVFASARMRAMTLCLPLHAAVSPGSLRASSHACLHCASSF